MYGLTLPIRDIALLKHDPIEYCKKHYTKTHDGTSSGRIRWAIRDFVSLHSNSAYGVSYHICEEGKMLHEERFLSDEQHSIDMLEFQDSLRFTGQEQLGFHLITKPPSDGNRSLTMTDHESGRTVNLPDKDMINLLNQKDESTGEYLLQSVTQVSPDKSTVTYIKNNQFNEENEYDLTQVSRQVQEDCYRWGETYEQEYQKEYKNILDNEPEMTTRQAEQLAHTRAVDSMGGTLTEHINRVWGPELEKCNVKVKTQSNSNVDYEMGGGDDDYDRYDYEYEWMDTHNLTFDGSDPNE